MLEKGAPLTLLSLSNPNVFAIMSNVRQVKYRRG